MKEVIGEKAYDAAYLIACLEGVELISNHAIAYQLHNKKSRGLISSEAVCVPDSAMQHAAAFRPGRWRLPCPGLTSGPTVAIWHALYNLYRLIHGCQRTLYGTSAQIPPSRLSYLPREKI